MLNVGWLDRHHAYPRGKVDPVTLRKILHLSSQKRNVMRGVQDCQFCDEESPLFAEDTASGLQTYLGTGEIRVEDDLGTLYAAPTLLYHYVLAHDYLPPEGFLEAVRSGFPGPRESHELETLFLPQVVAGTALAWVNARAQRSSDEAPAASGL
jgi:hypothetical protein